MIRVCKNDKESVFAMIRQGKLDAAALSTSNLVDEIILSMYKHGIFTCLENGICDKRAANTTVPFGIIWAAAIAAKMKVQTSLSDIPFALSDHRTLAELGYTLYDPDGVYSGLMREGSLRFLLGKYTWDELLNAYRLTVRDQIIPQLGIQPHIHILDCTPLEVNFKNSRYENSGIGVNKSGEHARGYSMLTMRGICGDSGIIEDFFVAPLGFADAKFGEIVLNATRVFHEGDILINDRGFLSRRTLNFVKNIHHVDTYLPLKRNMEAYKFAIQCAQEENCWGQHPNPKRLTQKIALVKNLGGLWKSDNPAEDVDINACVVWDTSTNQYFVFATTDLTKSAREIVKTYELRPEIEEDYRQLKDFWQIEDFKSTQYNVICFHIVCVLFGYLFFQLYTMLPEGAQFIGRSLPVILKSYTPRALGSIILYVGCCFGIFSLVEMMRIYAECNNTIKQKLEEVIGEL